MSTQFNASLIRVNKDVIIAIINYSRKHQKFTYKDLQANINGYTLSIHRRFIASNILDKVEKVNGYRDNWYLSINKMIKDRILNGPITRKNYK